MFAENRTNNIHTSSEGAAAARTGAELESCRWGELPMISKVPLHNVPLVPLTLTLFPIFSCCSYCTMPLRAASKVLSGACVYKNGKCLSFS